MRTLSILFFLAGLALVLGAPMAQGGLAVFTELATVTGNNFTTAASFACTAGDTGFLNPAAQAADTGGDGDGFELNPTNAFADDANFASNINGRDDRHRYYDYGISGIGSCTIEGIELRLDWWLDAVAGNNSMGVELSWDGGASWTAAKTDTVESTTEHTTILGGSADTWGRVWAVSEFSDANFRMRVSSKCSGSPTNCNPRDFFLDWVTVKVSYGP